MVSITQLAHQIVASTLATGEFAIDGTAGNGHDTLFLAQQVGPTGQVFAFDIQQAALDSTRHRLQQHQCEQQVQLILASHAEMKLHIPEQQFGSAGAAMFNLGYLPFQDHRLTTLQETTMVAVQLALEALRPGGALTVVAYRGHPGGDEEACAVDDWMTSFARENFSYFCYPEVRPVRGPQLLSIKKPAAC